MAVLRVTTLYASTAAATAQYYTRYLTQSDGEIPGVWTGHQAAGLGLSGEVSTEALQALLEGRDPATGATLGNPLVDRVTASGGVVRAVAGFDATLSAPKSLSIWWALTGDEGLAECHDVAVRAVVGCIEQYGSTTRIRSNGHRLHPETQGLTAAVFRQTTSRLDDPQLHSHVVISSKVQTEDGRWLALDARTLKGYQRALGGLYQSVLRAEVTARYGVAFGEIVKGQAEIAGVPEVLLEQFSKRTVQVDAAVNAAVAEFWVREGRDPTPKERGAIGRQAAADTRGHKTSNSVTDLGTGWIDQALGVGVTAGSLTADIEGAALRAPALDTASYEEVLVELVDRRSAWHRLDVLQAVCDLTRPHPDIDGAGWADVLERDVDVVLGSCVDLDPASQGRRRVSDGRSVWIEPSARHHTSPEILVQEEWIVSWAIDAQLEPPTRTPVVSSRLDVMQLEAASAIAGEDRLVLVVGPAGAGKTMMLAAAAQSLSVQGRVVLGFAPTAKAARKLETDTGIETDTVAKLVYEWTRPDRAPQPRWCLPAGATVVVDEAGMLDTGHLHTLTRLAEVCDWRVVLVGDPHQLQAVGRGGMFTELLATGRTIELETIHRFRNHWEAAASLQLRHGDPRGLDAYERFDRILPAPFAEHLDNIATAWINTNQCGQRVAITATSNDHVDAINRTVQQYRRDLDELGDRSVTGDHGDFHVGDVIVTRRNERHLHTNTGDSVRNRDYWTINGITDTGELVVTRADGHGTVTLPKAYVVEHVQLGYAATEPGNQSDTADRSITLASNATTCRGLYVAATRGRDENLICVVTDTHNLGDARDVLERILVTDRADLPAIATRRDLTATSPSAPLLTPAPAPVLAPRCEIPNLFGQLRTKTRDAIVAASAALADRDQIDAGLQKQIARLDRQLERHAPFCAPHDNAIAAAQQAVGDAQHSRQHAAGELARAGRLHRPAARHHLKQADHRVDAARMTLGATIDDGRHDLGIRANLTTERNDLGREQSNNQQAHHGSADVLDGATETLRALTTWHDWAVGHDIAPDKLADAAIRLDDQGRHYATLAQPLLDWCVRRGLVTIEPEPAQELTPVAERKSVGIEIDF